MQRVQGFGGFFFRAMDPEGLAKLYEDHLGINPEPRSGSVVDASLSPR